MIYFNQSIDKGTIIVNGAELTLNTDKNGNRYILIDNIHAKNLPTDYKLTVTHADGSSFTLQYSVYTNVKQILEGDSYTFDSKNL